jgi:hypothetical protein
MCMHCGRRSFAGQRGVNGDWSAFYSRLELSSWARGFFTPGELSKVHHCSQGRIPTWRFSSFSALSDLSLRATSWDRALLGCSAVRRCAFSAAIAIGRLLSLALPKADALWSSELLCRQRSLRAANRRREFKPANLTTARSPICRQP